MSRFFIALIVFCSFRSVGQTNAQDTIYLMNGHIVAEKVIDTLLGAVTIMNPTKQGKKIHYEIPQLYMVNFATGGKRYYYKQDTFLLNYFTRDEMWMYMKGERDSRKGFNPIGVKIGSGIAGLIGGMTGTFWGPVLPYGYMALSGITKVRIRHSTVSHPSYIESDGYILGYERVARHRRRIHSVFSGTIGLVIGYTIYAIFHNSYPENVDIGFSK